MQPFLLVLCRCIRLNGRSFICVSSSEHSSALKKALAYLDRPIQLAVLPFNAAEDMFQ